MRWQKLRITEIGHPLRKLRKYINVLSILNSWQSISETLSWLFRNAWIYESQKSRYDFDRLLQERIQGV